MSARKILKISWKSIDAETTLTDFDEIFTTNPDGKIGKSNLYSLLRD